MLVSTKIVRYTYRMGSFFYHPSIKRVISAPVNNQKDLEEMSDPHRARIFLPQLSINPTVLKRLNNHKDLKKMAGI